MASLLLEKSDRPPRCHFILSMSVQCMRYIWIRNICDLEMCGVAGFFTSAHQALTANAPQLWDLDHETGHPTAIGTAYGPPPGQTDSSTSGLVELNSIAQRVVSEPPLLPLALAHSALCHICNTTP